VKKNTPLITIGSIALILIISAVLAFANVVARAANFEFSQSAQDWAFFGDYLAGTVGPALSFLAFIGILWTIKLQTKQIEISKSQAVLEEMQRVISYLSANIDSALAREFPITMDGSASQQPLFRSLLVGAAVARDKRDMHVTHDERTARMFKQLTGQTLTLEFTTLTYELHQLAMAIQEYVACGGSTSVRTFYRNRTTQSPRRSLSSLLSLERRCLRSQ